jgi:hypothetical protein
MFSAQDPRALALHLTARQWLLASKCGITSCISGASDSVSSHLAPKTGVHEVEQAPTGTPASKRSLASQSCAIIHLSRCSISSGVSTLEGGL